MSFGLSQDDQGRHRRGRPDRGNGPEAKRGKMVGMYYEGRLKSNNKKFDACQSGKPFKFRLGHGEVIKGWDLGVEGLKVGRVFLGYPKIIVD